MERARKIKMMKVRLFMMALTLCLLPVMALAAIEPSQGVARSGSTVTLSGDYEEYTISGTESGVLIIVESGVKRLALNSASITAPEDQDALTAQGSLTLHLAGESTITGGSSYGDGGKGIVVPSDGKLTISGDGSLKVVGGDALYEKRTGAVEGRGGTAIVGSVTIHDGVRVIATGGSGRSGYEENDTWGGHGVEGNVEINGGQLNITGGSALKADKTNTAGDGIHGDAVVNGGQLIATGGLAKWGRNGNYGGHGVTGKVIVNGGQLTATGGAATDENYSTYNIGNYGGHGVNGNAEVNGGRVTATGGQASGGEETLSGSSENVAGHGVNGNAVVNGGQLIAAGSSASLSPNKNIGGNGINGAVTAAGGYLLATGGTGDESWMGKAAAATQALPVTLGSSEKRLVASVGENNTPDTPLNGGEYYTRATDETTKVSPKSSLETKEFIAVTYLCLWDGCHDSSTEDADCSKPYEVKNHEALGLADHGLTFAGFADAEGNGVESLTVSEPITLYAAWKLTFTFEKGEGGAGSMPSLDAITSTGKVRLPECGFSPAAGYRFAGWLTDSEDKVYAAGDEIPAAKEIHLTALWELLPVPPETGDSAMPIGWLLLCLASWGVLLRMRGQVRN